MKKMILSIAAVVVLFGAIIAVSVSNVRAQAKDLLPLAQQAPALSNPLVSPDQWRTSCTADGGAPVDVRDEVDGGTHAEPCGNIFISNASTTCVNVGSLGANNADPVDINTGYEIGTGSGCDDGPSVSIDGRCTDLGCTSQGAAVLVRVTRWQQ